VPGLHIDDPGNPNSSIGYAAAHETARNNRRVPNGHVASPNRRPSPRLLFRVTFCVRWSPDKTPSGLLAIWAKPIPR
jgi:hypothetical protein